LAQRGRYRLTRPYLPNPSSAVVGGGGVEEGIEGITQVSTCPAFRKDDEQDASASSVDACASGIPQSADRSTRQRS